MSLLSLDTEGFPFRPGRMAPPIVCLSYAEDESRGILIGDDIPNFVEAALDRAIDAPGEHIITGSYIAYDTTGFVANYPWLTKKIFAAYQARTILCTQVLEKLLDIAEGVLNQDTSKYNLDALALKYLGITLDKENPWRLRFGELYGVPLSQWPQEPKEYTILDAVCSRDVTEHQFARAAALGYTLPDAPEQTYADFALALASAWGFRTNRSRVVALDKQTTLRMGELKQELIAAGLYSVRTPKRGKFAGMEVGKKSNKRLQEMVTEAYQGRPPLSESGTRVALDKVTLEDVANHIPIVDPWLEFGRLEKTKSTYILKMYEGTVVPLHPRFNGIVGTGRNSSSGPNVHNQPRLPGVRECYEARKGYVYISCDYSSQEMRSWAQACMTIVGWSRLAERYRQDPDFDPHIVMAAQSLLRIPEEEAIARLKAKDKQVKADRQASKIANFGLGGGMGVNGLIRYARNYDGSRWAEPATCPGCAPLADFKVKHNCFASRLKKSWLETWPEAKPYFFHVRSVLEQSGRIVQLESGRWRGGCSFTEASNSYFQGLAADISKTALCEVSRRCYSVETSWLYGCRPIALVHDEILAECPEEYAHEAAMEMVEVMEEIMNGFTPDVPARAAPALMRNWSKNAEAVYDGGRLIPFEDAVVEAA